MIFVHKDATPGPGYYYNEEVSTCFSKKKNSKSNMSKFTRFKESLAEHNLGPGQYAISKDILFKNVNKFFDAILKALLEKDKQN